jgi:hypothetical protein
MEVCSGDRRQGTEHDEIAYDGSNKYCPACQALKLTLELEDTIKDLNKEIEELNGITCDQDSLLEKCKENCEKCSHKFECITEK